MATPKKARKKRHPAALPAAAARAALDRATKDIKTLQKSASRNSWAIGPRLAQVAEVAVRLRYLRPLEPALDDRCHKIIGTLIRLALPKRA